MVGHCDCYRCLMRDNREDLTLSIGIVYLSVQGACYCASAALAPGGAGCSLRGAGSSLTSGLIICAMTGWFCLSCMILVMAWMKALGLPPKLLPPLVADLTQWR